VKNPNHEFRTTSTAAISSSPTRNTSIARGRSRRAGRSVNMPSIQAAASAHSPRSSSSPGPSSRSNHAVSAASTPSSTYGPTVTTGGHRRPQESSHSSGPAVVMIAPLPPLRRI
jgi:hypothetical protein